MMEDDLWCKTNYDGRRLMMEDDLWWKTTYDGRQLMMEDNLWWKTTYDRRRLMMEDDLWWKTTYDGRSLMMEDDLWWGMTYDGRRPIPMPIPIPIPILMGEGDYWWSFPSKEFSPQRPYVPLCVIFWNGVDLPPSYMGKVFKYTGFFLDVTPNVMENEFMDLLWDLK